MLGDQRHGGREGSPQSTGQGTRRRADTLFWVLLSSKFRAGVSAIFNSQTFSLRVEEQIGKEEKLSRVRKSVDLDLCGLSATSVSILYLAFRLTCLRVIDPCP